MTKMVKRLISVILVLSMVLGSASYIFAAETTSINYVSFGDSNDMPYGLASLAVTNTGETYNTYGYKIDTSSTLTNTDGQKIADISRLSWMGQFVSELEEDGLKVNWDNLAVAGSRLEELHMLLDLADDSIYTKYMGDGCTNFLMINWIYQEIAAAYGYSTEYPAYLYQMSTEYIAKTKDADVISIELGENSYGMALIYEFLMAMQGYGDDLGIQNLLDVMGCDVNINAIKTQFMDVMEATLGTKFDRSSAETIDKVIDFFVYTYLSFIYNFDYDIQRIYELNKDVEIYVASHGCTISEMSVDMDGTSIPLGKLLEALYGMMDTYVGVISEYSDTYHFIDFNSVDPEGLWEALLNGTISEKENYYVDSLVKAQYGLSLNANTRSAVISKIREALTNSQNTVYFTGGSSTAAAIYLAGGTVSDAEKEAAEKQIVADCILYYDYAAGLHCSFSGHTAKASAMIKSYDMVQETGVTAREYCIYKELGLYDIKDKMQASVDKLSAASSAITESYETLTTQVKSSNADTYQNLVYGTWSDINSKINESLTSLAAIGPFSNILASTIKLSKTATNVGLLFATMAYENGGYATLDNGCSATVISGGDAAYSSELKDSLGLSSDPTIVKATGNKTAQQLVGSTKSDLYVVDVDSWDVKNNPSGITKFITDAVVTTYKTTISKNADFLYKCGISNAKDAAKQINNMITEASDKMNSVSGALAIETEAHKINKNAIVAYLGRTDAGCELERIVNDVTNMSLFTNAMVSSDTVYIDRQNSSDTVGQITKHLKTVVSERDYTDNIKSVIVNDLDKKTDIIETVDDSVQTVTTKASEILDKFPVTKKIIQDSVEQIKQDLADTIKNLFNR